MSAQQQEQLNTGSAAPARTTGYESIRDLSDAVRSLIPKGTEVVLGIVGFTLDTSKGNGKEFIRATYEVLAPEEYEDYGSFRRDYYLGNTPKPGKNARSTSWHMMREELTKIQAAIYQTPPPSKTFQNEDITLFFADVDGDPAVDKIAFFEGVTAKLNTLANQNFPTRLGVEDKDPNFAAKQTVGSPLYPTEQEYVRSGGGNGAG